MSYAQGHHQQGHYNQGYQPQGYGGQQQHHTSNTTVIVQQPTSTTTVREWSTGVCACFDDCAVCCCGLFCGTCLLMRTASRMDENPCLVCCMPYYLTALRTKIRTQENINGSICNDCLLDTYCWPCANCQLAREVKYVDAKNRRR